MGFVCLFVCFSFCGCLFVVIESSFLLYVYSIMPTGFNCWLSTTSATVPPKRGPLHVAGIAAHCTNVQDISVSLHHTASPRAHLHVVGMLWFMSNSRACKLLFVFVPISVFMALSTAFHSINSPDNSPLSHSVLPVLILPFNYISL